MYYDGTAGEDPYAGWSIGVAAGDGEQWKKRAENPVLTPGPAGWDAASVHDPRVVQTAGGYSMWYSGFDGARWRIGLARSNADGILWLKDPDNPVLDVGAPGAWDEAGVAYSTVRPDGAGYQMWYQGQDASGRWQIGHAKSPDGVTWARDPANPVMAVGGPGRWDSERVFTPEVVPWGGGWLMFYAGSSFDGAQETWGLGEASSRDGSRWRKSVGNPTIRAPFGGEIMTPATLVDGYSTQLWYAGHTADGWAIVRQR